MMTSLAGAGTWAGVQLAARGQAVLTLPFQVMVGTGAMATARSRISKLKKPAGVEGTVLPSSVASPVARLRR